MLFDIKGKPPSQEKIDHYLEDVLTPLHKRRKTFCEFLLLLTTIMIGLIVLIPDSDQQALNSLSIPLFGASLYYMGTRLTHIHERMKRCEPATESQINDINALLASLDTPDYLTRINAMGRQMTQGEADDLGRLLARTLKRNLKESKARAKHDASTLPQQHLR